MAELVERLLDALMQLSEGAIYLLVAVLCWAEAAFFLGFVTPGELAVATGGILASRGQIDFLPLLGVVVMGTLAGNATGFALGRRWGTGFLQWRPLQAAFGPTLEGAQAFMRKRGEWAIVVGRVATPTRIAVPFLAGAARMSYRRFVIFDIPATLAWATVWTTTGYLLGESWELVSEMAGTAAVFVLILFVLGLVIRWVSARLARNQRRVLAAWKRLLRATGTEGVARRLTPAAAWLVRRFQPRMALGLSLTVSFLALLAAAGAVGLVLSQTQAVRGLALVDFPVLEWMVATRTDEAVAVARGILQYLRWPAVLWLAAAFSAVVFRLRGPVPALRVLVGIAGAGAGAWALDQFVLEGLVPRAEFPSVPVAVTGALLVHATAVTSRRFGWSPAVGVAGGATFLLAAVSLGTVVAGWAAPSGIALGAALGLGWGTILELPRTLLGAQDRERPPNGVRAPE